MIDNKKIKVKDFYKVVIVETDCQVCGDAAADFLLMDGYDTRICENCSHKTLEDCSFQDDYESNRFLKSE